jgi:hypothetical protein
MVGAEQLASARVQPFRKAVLRTIECSRHRRGQRERLREIQEAVVELEWAGRSDVCEQR